VSAGLLAPLSTGRLPSALEAERHAALVAPAAGAGLLFLAGGLLAFFLRGRARLPVLALLVAFAWATLDLAFARVDALRSPRGLALALEAELREGDTVVAYRRYPQGLGLHTRLPILLAGGSPGDWTQREIVEPYATRCWESARRPGGAPCPLLADAEWEALWRGSSRVLAVVRHGEIAPLGAFLLSGPHAGAGRTDLFVVSNHPPVGR
jgi:hypothetical protein